MGVHPPLSSQIARPREDGGGNPSRRVLQQATCHAKGGKAKPRILVALLSFPFHFTTEKNESPPPLSLPPSGGKVRMGVHPPLSSQIARPREDGGGSPSRLPFCVLAHAGTHPSFPRRAIETTGTGTHPASPSVSSRMGDPSLFPHSPHVIPSAAKLSREFSSSLLSLPFHFTTEKNESPPLLSLPPSGGKARMGVHPPLSSQIAHPREDRSGSPSRLPPVSSECGTHTTFFSRQPLTPSQRGSPRILVVAAIPLPPPPPLSLPPSGGKVRMGVHPPLPCPRACGDPSPSLFPA